MKQLFYSIYALLFNLSARIFKLKENRVAFVSMHNENFKDSLGCVYEKMKEQYDYEFVLITRRDLDINIKNVFRVISFFLFKSAALARSKYVFLNDNFLPMSKMNFKKETVVTQLWHAEGAFKKFGLDIPQQEFLRKSETESNKRLTYVVCSSEGVRDIYSSAFGVSKENVLALGAPRADYFFKEENTFKAKADIENLYPQLKGKKTVLYAPTFRDNLSENKNILKHFDAAKIKQELGEEYEILVRLHPQIHENGEAIKGAIDVTDYADVRQLVLYCDVLVTDYSSICMDFSLINKKTVFFAYDLQDYIRDRDFYFDYESYVPGVVAKTNDELIRALKTDFDREKNDRFRQFNFSFFDANSSQRVIDTIIKTNNE